jgi:hypothetical protein
MGSLSRERVPFGNRTSDLASPVFRAGLLETAAATTRKYEC